VSDASLRVRFLTKPGCHLCDDARPVLEAELAASGRRPTSYDEVDITTDDELYARFWTDIPVVLVDDEVIAVHRLAPGVLASRLRP
jgi:hypothetical protein